MKCLESQLSEATSRISELQVKQLQLEARNALLQAVADSALKSTPSEVPSTSTFCAVMHSIAMQFLQSIKLCMHTGN